MTYSAASLAWARDQADAPHATRDLRDAERAIARAALRRQSRPITGHMPDREIRLMADERADLMRREIDAQTLPMATHQAADWLRRRVAELDARPFSWPGCDDGEPPPAGSLAGMFERAQCPTWWRRQLRRAVVLARELEGMQRGEVCAKAGAIYCTHDTVARRRERNAANRAMLEATEIEDAAGEVITLAQAADAGVANKAIRRGELMTRIRGCEEWAEAAGLAGVFTTNTTPSRFHAQTMHAGPNPKHDGSTPKDGQRWLCKTWARTRAALARYRDRSMWCSGCDRRRNGRTLFGADLWEKGLQVFGFRVAEPHHDATPHWHMLLWCAPSQVEALAAVMRAQWLHDDGDEPGAAEHRCKVKALERGGAAGYVAKYVAKNIDDAGAVDAEGHHDTDHAGQSDWVGRGKAQRVEAWAGAWGIRQFQAIGQPPVTVWRELRRVEAREVQGAAPAIVAAHAAVHRDGARRADWRAYMQAQGGPFCGRAYGIRIERREVGRVGRYGDAVQPAPLGVVHISRPGELVYSSRREWRPRGTWAPDERAAPDVVPGFIEGLREARPVDPRTRLNNCTRAGHQAEPAHRRNARMGPLWAALAWSRTGTGGWRDTERSTP